MSTLKIIFLLVKTKTYFCDEEQLLPRCYNSFNSSRYNLFYFVYLVLILQRCRQSLTLSELVVLPYQTLLHESTRLASGIDLRNSVVIIDEAHNLVEALNSMYSCQVGIYSLLICSPQIFLFELKSNAVWTCTTK